MSTRFDNPKISSIPIHENFEKLIDINQISSKSLQLDNSKRNQETIGYKPDFRLRAGACQRLLDASRFIPDGYIILVKDCLRTANFQAKIFTQRLTQIRKANPQISLAECRSLCARYIAPPEAAGHPTGGAIDVVLCNPDLIELDMGTPYDAAPETCDNACFTDSSAITLTAQSNRKILINAMTSAGFANYPCEWWHWSFGDRYWAFARNKTYAIYSAIV